MCDNNTCVTIDRRLRSGQVSSLLATINSNTLVEIKIDNLYYIFQHGHGLNTDVKPREAELVPSTGYPKKRVGLRAIESGTTGPVPLPTINREREKGTRTGNSKTKKNWKELRFHWFPWLLFYRPVPRSIRCSHSREPNRRSPEHH